MGVTAGQTATSGESQTAGKVTVVNMAPGTFQIQRQAESAAQPAPKPVKGGSLGLFFRKVRKKESPVLTIFELITGEVSLRKCS